MKSKIRKRLLALMLCIAMVVNGSGSVLADDGTLLEEQEVVSEEAVEIVEETEEVVEEEAIVEEEIEEVAVEEVVEVAPITLNWSEDGVTVTVTEKVAGAIPEGTTLSVTPIVEGEEYTAVETGLQEKAANEEYELAGFLAYDICLVDAAGNEIEPNDNVNVSIEYDEAVIPEMEVAEDAALDVTVMHFEEDANGEVAQIVDMVAEEEIEAAVVTTDAVEVEKAEFVTGSFSTFTITWTYQQNNFWGGTTTYSANIVVHYVDTDGEELDVDVSDDSIPLTTGTALDLQDTEYKIDIPGYTFDSIRINSVKGNELRYIRIRQTQSGGMFGGTNSYFEYSLNNSTNNDDWTREQIDTSVNRNIYIVYESAYKVTADIIDLEGVNLGTKTISLKPNVSKSVVDSKIYQYNNIEYSLISAYVMDGETKIEVASLLYKEGKYFYIDDTGVEGELTSRLFLEYAAPGTIAYQAVKMNKQNLTTGNIDIPYGETYKLSKLGYMTVNGTRYTYVSAYIISDGNEIVVKEITYDEGKYFYTDSEGELIELNGQLYVKYRSASDDLTTIETLDHSSDGIVIKMQNYKEMTNKNQFMNLGGSFYDNGKISQGLVFNTLNADGYPVAVNGKTTMAQGTDLNRIFGGTSGDAVVNGKLDGGVRTVNHLFSEEIYNETGYYEYSSFENYAWLDQTTNNFVVYQQLGVPNKTNNSEVLYLRGNFLPYNNITNDNVSSDQFNLYDEDANRLQEGDHRYNEPLHEVASPDFYFGMSMEASFIQPRDGKVTWKGTTSEMRYEFNGDDDLWVFIDDVLVLDLGGIHVAHRGYIDFSTGEIYIDKSGSGAAPTLHGTLKDAFEDAGQFPDGSNWDAGKVNDYFTGNTFKNFSSHEMKMFYMERGDGASDLHVRFNLPTIEKDAVTIQKEISNYTTGAYSDVEFSFNMYVENETTHQFELVPAGKAYTHVSADGKETPATVGENGVFKLKHNEKAVFKDITSGTKYYVEEIGLNQKEYDKVEIVGSGILNESGSDIGANQSTIKTKELTVGSDLFVLFQNRCAASNMKQIYISKVLKDAPSDKFTVKVTVGGKPYTGEYKLVANGQDASASSTVLKAGADGNITLRANQTAIILGYATLVDENNNITKQGIPSGTSFKVEEVKLSVDKYKEPTYRVEAGSATNISEANGYNGYALGELILENNAKVVITNTLRTSQLVLTKKFFGPTGKEISAPAGLDKIQLRITESYVATNSEDGYTRTHTLELLEEDGFIGTLTNVQTYTDFTIESETMYDADGNVIANAADWTMTGYSFDRYSNASVGAEYVASLAELTYDMSASGYVLAKQGTQWYLVMKEYSNTNMDGAVAKILEAVSKLQNGITLTKENVQVITPVQAATIFGASVTYVTGGTSTFAFTNTAWSEFYQGRFNTAGIEVNGVLNNKVAGKTELQVTKEWVDENNKYVTRPDSITVSVLNGQTVATTLTLDATNNWIGTASELEKYDEDGNLINYTVREENVPGRYWAEVTGNTITNHMKYDWVIVKTSETDAKVLLKGAQFELRPTDKSGKTYYGLSEPNGDIKWYLDSNHETLADVIDAGVYDMVETVAPAGYMLSEEQWRLTFDDKGNAPIIEKLVNGKYEVYNVDSDEKMPLYTFYFTNKPMYELPSNGGFGIYMYMIGGMMLMAFATFVLYKNRRKEVLVR